MTGETIRITLAQVQTLYRAGENTQRLRHQVDHPTLRRVHRDVRYLATLLARDEEEDSCGPLLRRLRRFCFLSASTPLPFDHPLLWPLPAQQLLSDAVALYPSIYPAFSEVILKIEANLDNLREAPENPLLGWLMENIPQRPGNEWWVARRSDRTLLVADSRVLQAVSSQMEAAGLDLRVSSALAFQEQRTVSAQIFLGTSRWFPDWCFTAPRAPDIALVQYHWVWDDAEYPATFASDQTGPLSIGFVTVDVPRHGAEAPALMPVMDGMSSAADDEIVRIDPPQLDWQRILARERQESQVDGQAQATVPARLHILQGFVGVWLASREEETVQGLQLAAEGNEKPRIERLRVEELQPGDVLLLRTEGAGDLLDTLANQMLGNDGVQARAIHRAWKKAVRQQVFRCFSHEKAVKRLSELGAVRASVSNLRQWETDDALRPQRTEDFHALIRFSGSEARFDEIVQATERLRSAQHAAGHHISQMLLNAIEATDLAALEHEGQQVFTPDGVAGGGSFTAYRLVDIAEEEVQVSPRRLNRPIQLEEKEYE